MKKIIKTAIGVSAIYIFAVFLSLVLCDRVSELESREDYTHYNRELSINLT